MTVTIYEITDDFYQGSDSWYAARCGILTSSNMDLCITKANLDVANNDKKRSHVWEIAAQRVTKYVEPQYLSDDMIRGHESEELAVSLYEQNYGPVQRACFITNDSLEFTLGYSPDGLIGDRGIVEVKSPRQKGHMKTIVEGKLPDDHVIQVQTELLVSGRDFCKFISYHGGMPMFTINVDADYKIQEAIIRAAQAFEEDVCDAMVRYAEMMSRYPDRFVPTERKKEVEWL